MISWGIVTILTGFIQNTGQFYTARFLLGAAEASFVPAVLVYLTRWFSLRDRSKAIACLFAALPVASLIGAPLAGLLLGVRWMGLAGWRWLFILEGLPAVLVGIITLRYLTDRPAQASWLTTDERCWIDEEIAAEVRAKRRVRQYTILEAFRHPRVVMLTIVYFLVITGALANIYWIPTFVKRLSGAPVRTVTSLLIIPACIGFIVTLANGWHSDKTGERRWHAAGPLLATAAMYCCVAAFESDATLAIAFLLIGSGILYSFYPVFWSLPTDDIERHSGGGLFRADGLGIAAGRHRGAVRHRLAERQDTLPHLRVRFHRPRLPDGSDLAAVHPRAATRTRRREFAPGLKLTDPMGMGAV